MVGIRAIVWCTYNEIPATICTARINLARMPFVVCFGTTIVVTSVSSTAFDRDRGVIAIGLPASVSLHYG